MTVKELIAALSALSDEDKMCNVEVQEPYDRGDWQELDSVRVVPEKYGTWSKELDRAIHKVVRLS